MQHSAKNKFSIISKTASDYIGDILLRKLIISFIMVFLFIAAGKLINASDNEKDAASFHSPLIDETGDIKSQSGFVEKRDSFYYNGGKLKYMLVLPAKYYIEKKDKWPMIMFLHGGSCKGDNLDLVKIYGPAKYAEEQADFPFVVLAPQLPLNKWWTNVDTLAALLDDIIARYNIDEDRIYLTGMSLGGHGAWNLAAAHSEYFAALAPIASYASEPDIWAKCLTNIPIWVIHGDQDDLAPLSVDEKMVDALRECGASPRFTILKGRDHFITDVYENNELYDWFLTYKRKP
jgi:predicted peptidase